MKPDRTRAVVACALAVLVVAAFVVWSNSRSHGIVVTQYHKSTDSVAVDKELRGAHFSLKYQNNYTKRVLPAKDNNIELYELRANTVYDKRLLVEITHLPSGNLTDDGSYNMRRVHPERYGERLLSAHDSKAHVMVKLDANEQVVFMARGKMLATLAFVTDGDGEMLAREVDQVVASFQWTP